MGLDALLVTMERRAAVTPVTPGYPDGVTAKALSIKACTPVTPVTPESDNAGPHATNEEAAELRALLLSIGAHNGWTAADIAQATATGLTDPEAALTCWRSISDADGIVPVPVDDDRRRCNQCANLTRRGLCLAARRGAITAHRNYEPASDIPRRCEGYAPGTGDPDQRPGRERWPGLKSEGGAQ